MNRNDRRREVQARDVIARRAAAAAEANARVFRPPPNDGEEGRFTWRSFASTRFRWNRVIVVVLAVTMIVTFFSDPLNWMPETSRQKNADVFRQAELQVQQSHGGLSPAQQKELDDLRQLNERRRRRDRGR